LAEIISGVIASLMDDLPSLGKQSAMKMIVANIRTRVFPPIPLAISDDFALLRADRIRSQTPLLFITLFLTTPTAAFASAEAAPAFIRFGFPILMGLMCLLGCIVQFKTRHIPLKPRRARRMIRESDWVSGTGAVLCSVWCVVNWFYAPPETRIYYPMIMAMGSLATAFCLSTMRWATILNLGIGLLPISLLLIFAGNRLDLAAGISLFLAAAFLLRMIFQQHVGLVNLLTLQRQMRELATTDPLTGLLNRRALSERLDAEIATASAERSFAIALLDLDGFKPINDRYGHATGDIVLREVANRLRAACDGSAIVGRLGGDEFAILVPCGSALLSSAIADHMLAALVPPYLINGHVISLSAGVGVAHWPGDGTTPDALFETADRALYAAKAAVKEKEANLQRPTGAAAA
jgi:diguanylate cyclase